MELQILGAEEDIAGQSPSEKWCLGTRHSEEGRLGASMIKFYLIMFLTGQKEGWNKEPAEYVMEFASFPNEWWCFGRKMH